MVRFQENPRHDSILPHIRGDDKETTKHLCVLFSVEENKHHSLHYCYSLDIKYYSKNFVCAFQSVKFFINGT